MKLQSAIVVCFALLGLTAATAAPVNTAFTYQGRLNDGLNPANGRYDLKFTLYDAVVGGTPLENTQTNNARAVSNGLFTAVLDFGSVFDGNVRWLQIEVRTNGAASFTPLSPRQPLMPAPFAIYASSAGTALNVSPSADVTGARLNIGSGNTLSGASATIAGGDHNSIPSTASQSSIGGGSHNTIQSNAAYATIPGGEQNTAGGQYSFAAGRRAKAMYTGSFVWGDSTDADVTSTGDNQFVIRAAGGVGIGTQNPQAHLHVAGAVAIGNTTDASPPAGTLRWTGTDLEGYTGTNWVSLTGRGNAPTNTVTPYTNMVWIAPGTFVMGSPSNEVDRVDWEGPQTTVTLTRGFFMSKYEVTQGEYLAVMGSNPSHFTGANAHGDDPARPVETVSWNDAVGYCLWLTQRERDAGRIPANYQYRLPTEAEWEFACRAGTTTRFSYGDDPGYGLLGNYAWYYENSGSTTHPVGRRLHNPWGLDDMHGNVFEWCQDWYGTYPGGSVTDPQGPPTGSYRVVRGGGWLDYAGGCRSARRSHSLPDLRLPNLGFQVVLAPGQ